MRSFTRRPLFITWPLWHAIFSGGSLIAAQAPAATQPPPDVLVLVDDERLVGHFTGSSGTSVSFKSDVLGDVKIDWSKVKELHTQGQYAVLPKNARLRPHMETTAIPQGTLEANAESITVARPGGAPQTVSIANAAEVIGEATFQKEISPPHIPFYADWTGAATTAASLVVATQESVAISGALHLTRAIPPEAEFPPRNRTSFDFVGSEGHVTQRNTPEIKTEILHADVERDQYFTISGVYGFGQASFDHNYSQGLTLQQDYGGGLGWTMIRRANDTLDVKGSVNYIRQQFHSFPAENLIGSNFAQSLLHKFAGGATLSEQIAVTLSWNNTHAWFATGNAALSFPVYKSMSFTLSILESYLNNPPPGFRRNSFQAASGLTFNIK